MSRAAFKEAAGVDNDVWDDSALIKMYDDSIAATYRKLGTETASSSAKTNPGSRKWNVGQRCVAPYYEDEQWYPATIVEVKTGDALVRFDGYENEEWVKLEDLFDESAYDESDDSAIASNSETTNRDPVCTASKQNGTAVHSAISSSEKNNSIPQVPAFAPPPPPQIFSRLVPPDETEALSSMLMSWYMSGYHSGYYQAMLDAKKKK